MQFHTKSHKEGLGAIWIVLLSETILLKFADGFLCHELDSEIFKRCTEMGTMTSTLVRDGTCGRT